VIYKDKLDRTVSIPLPVKRAVFFQTYELIPALGIWNRVVGIGRYAYNNDLMKAAMPDIRKKYRRQEAALTSTWRRFCGYSLIW